MTANIDPIYSRAGDVQGVEITAGNTKSDGSGTIGTDIFQAAQVDTNNGGFVQAVEFWPTATANATATTATVGRVFISSQANANTSTSAANTHPVGEVSLASQTADSSTNPVFPVVVPINRALPPGYTVLVTNHVIPATNTKWKAVVRMGKY